jgi:hypothetical protein
MMKLSKAAARIVVMECGEDEFLRRLKEFVGD